MSGEFAAPFGGPVASRRPLAFPEVRRLLGQIATGTLLPLQGGVS
jgi:hypothetical protein